MYKFLVPVLLIVACSSPEDSMPPVGVTRPVIDAIKQPLKCTLTSASAPFDCINYAFTDPPPGFADCAGDLNTYDGEITLHIHVNFGEYCVWAHPPVGTCVALPGPMHDLEQLHANHITERLHNTSTFFGQAFSGANYTGQVINFPVAPFGQPIFFDKWFTGPSAYTKSVWACNAW